jgi:hypothetical protein
MWKFLNFLDGLLFFMRGAKDWSIFMGKADNFEIIP